MTSYELLFILKPTLTEEEIQAQIDSVKSDIAAFGGEVLAVDTTTLGMRKLAYEIDKNPRGYYVIVYHKSPTSSIAELERKLRYNENVLRFLTIKYTKKKDLVYYDKMVANAGGSKTEETNESEVKEEKSSQSEA